jgi:hypothetical protein
VVRRERGGRGGRGSVGGRSSVGRVEEGGNAPYSTVGITVYHCTITVVVTVSNTT